LFSVNTLRFAVLIYLLLGSYGYFQLKLKDIFTYPDLRPEVLHNFRIFGNAVIILNLLDMGVNQLDATVFLTTAPFLGFTPEDMRPSENESPLYVNISKVASFLQSKPELCKFPANLQYVTCCCYCWLADAIIFGCYLLYLFMIPSTEIL